MEHEKLKKDVLMTLIDNYVSIMPGAEIVPSSVIARHLKQPLNDVRKVLKELKSEGLVRYSYEGGWDEYYERPYCNWGYYITKKVKGFPEFIEAQRKEEELIRDIFRFEREVKEATKKCEL